MGGIKTKLPSKVPVHRMQPCKTWFVGRPGSCHQLLDKITKLIAHKDHQYSKNQDPKGLPPVSPDDQVQQHKVERQPGGGVGSPIHYLIKKGGVQPVQKKKKMLIDRFY